MPSRSNFDRRIRPPRDFSPVLEALTGQRDSVFDSKAEVLVFAAAVGFHAGKRRPLDATGEGIRLSVFENLRFGSMVMNTIAFVGSGNPDIFKQENIDDYATVFEEYAHAGLELLRDQVCDVPGSHADHLVAMIQRVQDVPGSDERELLKSLDLDLG